MIVAIDGPAGAGKSTVARQLAAQLGAAYLDTGAMYRAVAWLALDRGVATDDADALGALAHQHPVRLTPTGHGNRVEVAGHDVTDHIRTPRVAGVVSSVAAHASVREACVAAQRLILSQGMWVCDGRDIGTVVWPQAELKIYLVADPRERARRRHAELAQRGTAPEFDQVLATITERDRIDSQRVTSPMKPAEDAVHVDSTGRSVDEVVAELAHLAHQRGAAT